MVQNNGRKEGGGANGIGIYIDGGLLYAAVWNRGGGTSLCSQSMRMAILMQSF